MKREDWIDLAKGVAILLVVLGHVINSYIVSGEFNEYISYTKYVYFTIYSFHMPLYFALSGYLYSKSKAISNVSEYKKVALKKIIALGIPYIIFSLMQGTIQILLSRFTHNHIGFSSLAHILTQPILQFWFIYTLLFIFILVPLLEMIIKNDKFVFLLLFVFKIVSFFIVTNVIAIDTFSQYAVYFYSGKMLCKYYKYILSNKSLLMKLSTCYIVLNVLCYFGVKDIYNIRIVRCFASIMLAVLGSALIMYLVIYPMAKTKVIKKYVLIMGIYSFEIYIFHIIFSYGMKTVLLKLNIQSLSIHLFLDTLVGILIPIAIALIAKKIPFIYYMIYPNKFFKKKVKTQINLTD